MTTIYAVSSGRPPAAIAVVRISGPAALAAGAALAGSLPPARTAATRLLRAEEGRLLDRALVLAFPGPHTATGEDLVELHCHGGRAIVAAVEAALAKQPDCRPAEPGEFTRRALTNGRIDLAQAEGLADLLEAETEAQRVAALGASEGRISRQITTWLSRVADLSARVEVMLDYSEQDDVADDAAAVGAVLIAMRDLGREIGAVADAPTVERLRDGVRIVIAGPPNVGKSTLLNMLADRDAAIVSPIAGTTRDRIEAGVVREGAAYLLLDTAGLTLTDDVVEAIGVARARQAMEQADLLLWLGDDLPPAGAIWIQSRADLPGRNVLMPGRAVAIRNDDAASVAALWTILSDHAALLVPRTEALPLRERHRGLCQEAAGMLIICETDLLLVAERLRQARRALANITGVDATESMLDALFSRFCLGK